MKNTFPKNIPVDHAAQIFVSISSPKETTMSRIALTLKNTIDQEKLEIALKNVIEVFPFFQVYLKKQFYNYVFEKTDNIPSVEEDTRWTNRYINFNKNNFPFRVKSFDKTIALEMSHIISDGFGTLSFLLSITSEYLRLCNYEVDDSLFVKKIDTETISEEWECAFRSTFPLKGPKIKLTPAAYVPTGKMIPVEKYYSTRIIMDLESLRLKARNMNVTLNVYLSAIYAFAIQNLFIEDIANGKADKNLPIRLQIPVNMRKYYPTKNLRNFSYLYSPAFTITGGSYTFTELVKKISYSIRHERHSKYVEHQISRNLRTEKNILFKVAPRFIKQFIFRIFYHLFARSQYSGVITNMGDIKLPDNLAAQIESFDIIPCNSPVPGRNTALFSYKGKLEMNIGSSCNDLRLENEIINIMKSLEIDNSVVYKRDT